MQKTFLLAAIFSFVFIHSASAGKPDEYQAAWQKIMDGIQSGVNPKFPDSSSGTTSYGINKILMQGIEEQLDMSTVKNGADIKNRIQVLEWFEASHKFESYTPELQTKITYALASLRQNKIPQQSVMNSLGRADADPTFANFDDLMNKLGMPDSNPELAQSVSALFETHSIAVTSEMNEGDAKEFWAWLAKKTAIGGGGIGASQAFYDKLAWNNEWTNFNSYVSIRAMEHAAQAATVEGYASVAMHLYPMFRAGNRFTTEIAFDLLKGAEDQQVVAQGFKRAEAISKKLNFGSDRHHGEQLIKTIQQTALEFEPCVEGLHEAEVAADGNVAPRAKWYQNWLKAAADLFKK